LSWKSHSTGVDHVLFSADGTTLFAASEGDRQVHAWLVPTGTQRPCESKPQRSYTAGGNVRGLARHPSEGWLACSAGDDTIQFLSTQTLQPLRPPLTWRAGRLRFSPAGDLILTRDGRLHFLNRYQRCVGATVADAAPNDHIEQLAVGPDGVLLASACQVTRQVRLWERPGGRLLAQPPFAADP